MCKGVLTQKLPKYMYGDRWPCGRLRRINNRETLEDVQMLVTETIG